MDRLMKKWETAKSMVPSPQLYQKEYKSKDGILFFGTSHYAAEEAMDMLKQENIVLDALRIKAFPFNHEVQDFIDKHDRVFVIEQNRDAQMKSLLMIELGANPANLISILNYDGMPITAQKIINEIVAVVKVLGYIQ
jgi:2-oxoglutarate ferredoxin oxidoreductase subunit alpha